MRLEDPIGYFALADSMQQSKWDVNLREAVQRTIISRLYYGVFHYVKLKMYGPDQDNSVTHKNLIGAAQKYVNNEGLGINIKDHISQFQKMREKADYKRSQNIDEKFFKDALLIFDIVKKDCTNIWGKINEESADSSL
jgi:uncharacterized protein (UPF0332 family)